METTNQIVCDITKKGMLVVYKGKKIKVLILKHEYDEK